MKSVIHMKTQKISAFLASTALFAHIDPGQIDSLYTCLHGRVKQYGVDEIILLPGQEVKDISILVEGTAIIAKEDVSGGRSIVARLVPGDIFAETFACVGIPCGVTVQAEGTASVCFLSYKEILRPCQEVCTNHSVLIQNLLRLMAEKNLTLSRKLGFVAKRTIRQKVASYLLEQASHGQKTGTGIVVEIPFNRQQLADFLETDRSALSRELCTMREEGIIEFWKNSFKLTDVKKLAE